MDSYISTMILKTSPCISNNQALTLNNYRFSIITPEILRIEKQNDGIFCDEATQSVINRAFCKTEFMYSVSKDYVKIITSSAEFYFDPQKDTMNKIILKDGRTVTDYKKGNLKGTRRTLDNVNGKTQLNDGVISLSGVAILDDSNSLILCNDGKVLPRKHKEKDVYFFAYGYEYRKAVKDLFSLTGNAPLIPRFTLGNWWSRYKAYTQEEYIKLMQQFIDEKIPITVATIDMDWHWVNVVEKFGKDAIDKKKKNSIFELFYNAIFPGWTGYSWNTDLFPDHKYFLNWLKKNGFRITMNLHPASGCKFYEDAYSDFCDFMGIDKNTRQQIAFDITDEKFIEGYFKFLHHPHESEGVDFWWIDWQQGKNSAVKGLDPLWALNHYHSLNIARNGNRPLILSRFAGAGSQRYPLGFSGDTVQTWESLDFQPYFTSTASNIAYSWWSHDIGGHCRGYRDDELYLRWLQFGVFSPINRLHSTSNEFMGKEPWMYDSFIKDCASEFLRFRHRLIPYIYSMNRLTATEGKCLIEPMYYGSPKDSRAYKVPNEYYFGTELIVCPITQKCDEKTGFAGTKAYLPTGRYTDIFTGRIYNGNTLTELYRDRSSIPVLAKEGAIIPLSIVSETNDISNPDSFEILISKGNNSFTLYEDDGVTMAYENGAYCETVYTVRYKDNDLEFIVASAKGDLTLIPQKRSYKFRFIDIESAESAQVRIKGKDCKFRLYYDNNTLIIETDPITVKSDIQIKLTNIKSAINPDIKELKTQILSKYKCNNDKKKLAFSLSLNKNNDSLLPNDLKAVLRELDALI